MRAREKEKKREIERKSNQTLKNKGHRIQTMRFRCNLIYELLLQEAVENVSRK